MIQNVTPEYEAVELCNATYGKEPYNQRIEMLGNETSKLTNLQSYS
jgi:hypothetical protein